MSLYSSITFLLIFSWLSFISRPDKFCGRWIWNVNLSALWLCLSGYRVPLWVSGTWSCGLQPGFGGCLLQAIVICHSQQESESESESEREREKREGAEDGVKGHGGEVNKGYSVLRALRELAEAAVTVGPFIPPRPSFPVCVSLSTAQPVASLCRSANCHNPCTSPLTCKLQGGVPSDSIHSIYSLP